MKIGVFDSGLGGLVIAQALFRALPNHDFVYYGDTHHMPYGDKDADKIITLCTHAVRRLIDQKCALILFACNTASAVALRYIQRTWLPIHAPDVRVLGIVVPTLESALASGSTRIGLIGTTATTQSRMYDLELNKLNPKIHLISIATPTLASLIESNKIDQAKEYAASYLSHLSSVDCLILGCTHYPVLKEWFRDKLGPSIHIISQDEIIAEKTVEYLKRHPEIDTKITRTQSRQFIVSRLSPPYLAIARGLMGEININVIE